VTTTTLKKLTPATKAARSIHPGEARAIRLAREARGLSIYDLAAALGVDRRTLRRWEAGRGRGPTVLRFGPLVDALGVTGEAFLAALDGGPALAQLTGQALVARIVAGEHPGIPASVAGIPRRHLTLVPA
jgi:transcriptional regulator with XRE-family HTH domain